MKHVGKYWTGIITQEIAFLGDKFEHFDEVLYLEGITYLGQLNETNLNKLTIFQLFQLLSGRCWLAINWCSFVSEVLDRVSVVLRIYMFVLNNWKPHTKPEHKPKTVNMNTKIAATQNQDNTDNADFETWAEAYLRSHERYMNVVTCTIAWTSISLLFFPGCFVRLCYLILKISIRLNLSQHGEVDLVYLKEFIFRKDCLCC